MVAHHEPRVTAIGVGRGLRAAFDTAGISRRFRASAQTQNYSPPLQGATKPLTHQRFQLGERCMRQKELGPVQIVVTAKKIRDAIVRLKNGQTGPILWAPSGNPGRSDCLNTENCSANKAIDSTSAGGQRESKNTPLSILKKTRLYRQGIKKSKFSALTWSSLILLSSVY